MDNTYVTYPEQPCQGLDEDFYQGYLEPMRNLPETLIDSDGHVWILLVGGRNYVWDHPDSVGTPTSYEALVRSFGPVTVPDGEFFPIGSVVRFKQSRYRVLDYDGESHELEAMDEGAPEHRLLFQPDFFELVAPPEVSNGVYEDSEGNPYLVRDLGTSVAVVDSFGVVIHYSHSEFEDKFDRVL